MGKLIKRKRFSVFLVFLLVLLIVGEVAGIVTTYLVQTIFEIAYDLKTLLNTDPDYLKKLNNAVGHMIAIFFTSFTLAHWVFAL
jgi:predicted PurR-regulated permease PerM